MDQEHRVVIIGGGFAGLAAAYELVRLGQRPVVLEKSARLGGNVFTAGRRTQSQMDVGVIEIYEWSYCVNRIISELGLRKPASMTSGTVMLGEGGATTPYADTPSSWGVAKVVAGNLSRVLDGRSFYQLSRTEPLPVETDISTMQLLRSLSFRELLEQESLSVGYTYPSLKDFSAHLGISLGSRKDSAQLFYHCAMSDIVDAIAAFIEKRGGKIVTMAEDITLKQAAKSLTYSVNRNPYSLLYDDIVFACPLTESVKMLPAIQTLLGSGVPRYTHVYSVLVETNSPPTEWTWGAAFLDVTLNVSSRSGYKLLSVCNGNVKGCGRPALVLYLTHAKARPVGEDTFIAAKEILAHRLLAPLRNAKIVDIYAFFHAMPYADLRMIENVRTRNLLPPSVHFAGQYLGFPSIETAAYSGFRAAHEIAGRLPLFDEIMRKIDSRFCKI